jgi:hypothetical protein
MRVAAARERCAGLGSNREWISYWSMLEIKSSDCQDLLISNLSAIFSILKLSFENDLE